MKDKTLTDVSYDLEEELELRLRLAEAEVVKCRAALEAYRAASVQDPGFWKDIRLDWMSASDGLVALLEYAERNGREAVSVEEAAAVMRNFKVHTSSRSDRKLVSAVKHPHVLILRIALAPQNRGRFEVDRTEPRAQDYKIRLAKRPLRVPSQH